MIGIIDSVMSLGYKTSMALSTSVNQKNQSQNHCHVDVIHSDRSLHKRISPRNISQSRKVETGS